MRICVFRAADGKGFGRRPCPARVPRNRCMAAESGHERRMGRGVWARRMCANVRATRASRTDGRVAVQAHRCGLARALFTTALLVGKSRGTCVCGTFCATSWNHI